MWRGVKLKLACQLGAQRSDKSLNYLKLATPTTIVIRFIYESFFRFN